MSKKLILSVFVFSTFLLLGIEQALACICGGGANPCGFFRATGGVAFIGTVTNVVDANEKYGQPIKGKARKITIKVEEIFKGNLPGEIITSDDGYGCDNFPFKLGNTYLIYAGGVLENTENIVKIGLCSGTKTIENAQEDLKFLRPLKEGKTFSILYGKVQKTVNAEEKSYEPLPKTKVVLTKIYAAENGQYKEPKKKERLIETLTDENGEYKFENLGRGRYKLNAELSGNLWMPEYREFNAGGEPFCENHLLNAYINGRISGSVVSSEGAPIGFLKLSISPIDKNTRYYYGEAQTDKDGNYTFYGLSEGKYKIHVYLHGYRLDNTEPSPFDAQYPYWRWYFPNTFDDKNAQIINLGNTEKIQDINLKMPPFPLRQTVNGTVVREDGTPAKSISIYYKLKSMDEHSRRYIRTKENGSFAFEIFGEFEYEAVAGDYDEKTDVNFSSERYLINKENVKNRVKLTLKAKNKK